MHERTPLDLPVTADVQGVLGYPGSTETYVFGDGAVYGRMPRYGGDQPQEVYMHADGHFEYADGTDTDAKAERDRVLASAARTLYPTQDNRRLELLRLMNISPR